MTAAAMPRGNATLIVAAAFFAQRAQQGLLGPSTFAQLGKITDARSAAASSRRIVLANF